MLAQELTRVFQSTGGSGSGLLRFVPIGRINTLLVVTPRSAQLQTVQKWVDKLDVPPRGAGRGVYYYRMQNAKADDVARSLATVFGTAVVGDAGDTGADSLPPAEGVPAGAAPPQASRRWTSAAAMSAGGVWLCGSITRMMSFSANFFKRPKSTWPRGGITWSIAGGTTSCTCMPASHGESRSSQRSRLMKPMFCRIWPWPMSCQ